MTTANALHSRWVSTTARTVRAAPNSHSRRAIGLRAERALPSHCVAEESEWHGGPITTVDLDAIEVRQRASTLALHSIRLAATGRGHALPQRQNAAPATPAAILRARPWDSRTLLRFPPFATKTRDESLDLPVAAHSNQHDPPEPHARDVDVPSIQVERPFPREERHGRDDLHRPEDPAQVEKEILEPDVREASWYPLHQMPGGALAHEAFHRLTAPDGTGGDRF